MCRAFYWVYAYVCRWPLVTWLFPAFPHTFPMKAERKFPVKCTHNAIKSAVGVSPRFSTPPSPLHISTCICTVTIDELKAELFFRAFLMEICICSSLSLSTPFSALDCCPFPGQQVAYTLAPAPSLHDPIAKLWNWYWVLETASSAS